MQHSNIANVKSVDEFASYIRTRFQLVNKNWWEIAAAFAEAREMFGTESKSFKTLREITRFSESTITKLISIVSSERLKKYAVQLSSVQSWGTLYAISSLTEEQFEALKKNYKLDDPQTVAPFMTQTDVSKFKKQVVERSVFRGYAVIQVDDQAVKGSLLTGVEFEQLQRLLTKIESLSSYIAVKRVLNEEKLELSRLNRIDAKSKQIARRAYTEEINSILARHPKQKDENRSAHEVRVLGANITELMTDLEIDAAEAFKWLGLHYDVAGFYNKAEEEVCAAELLLADKYAKKVLSRQLVEKEPAYDEAEAMVEFEKRISKEREDRQILKNKIKATFDKVA